MRQKHGSLVREDEHGIFIRTGGYVFRPGAAGGFDAVRDMSTGGLKVGDHVKARHVASSEFCRIRLDDGRTLHWLEEHGLKRLREADARYIASGAMRPVDAPSTTTPVHGKPIPLTNQGEAVLGRLRNAAGWTTPRPQSPDLSLGSAMTTSRAALSAAIISMVEQFVDDEAPSATHINHGLCADFADALSSRLDVHVVNTEDLLAGDLEAEPPEGLSWDMLLAWDISDLGHSWIEHDGRHYDAERPEGVDNPFDLPCLRSGLHELIGLREPGSTAILEAGSDWWRETARIRRARENVMSPTSEASSPCP